MVDRDYNRENLLFEKYNVKKNEYVFVHDDKDRGYHISIYGDNVVRPDYSITDNIFDYLTLIENSSEIHCMDSCFFIMIDFLLNKESMFYHINTRGDYSKMFPHQGNGEFAHPRYQKKWKIIV